jgi:hypothetical protein
MIHAGYDFYSIAKHWGKRLCLQPSGDPVGSGSWVYTGIISYEQRSTVEGRKAMRPLLEARVAGYGACVLPAAAQGVGIYEWIGFRAFGGITEYKPRTG